MKFKNLNIEEWKQFKNLNINFHDQLTILTGANGAGKTTILNLLARHFGWSTVELSTPAKDKKTGFIKFFTRFFKKPIEASSNSIGSLTYDDNVKSSLEIPANDSAQYHIEIKPQKPVLGFNIPSHRPTFHYQPVSQLSLAKRNKQLAFHLVSNSSKNRLFGGTDKPSNYYIKETLLTWNIFGYGNPEMEPDPEYMGYYQEFQEVLKKILPGSLGFQKFSARKSEIVMVTESGEYMLDGCSGGISALVDLSWQIFMFSTKEKQNFTVLIDELENHLHATMQRAILPDLISAFPNVQFVVSTHSPLIIGSVKDSNVYALRYNEEKKIESELLDLENKAKNATEILNEVLGVSFTMPIWVENSLNQIVNEYSDKEMTETLFDEMRKELETLGLKELMPLAIKNVLKK
ncbi:AAA family ATPase [uncultured Aquimarina sp.]|uniref:AAA family ATPase n=1 Tax=uncultured Aquimarina sp. TaxID=575652 RepID=UPI0026079D44|nr:AAA family ATPase [uncultured Aquimarina sp.]